MDPQAAGALFRRRLCVGRRCGGQGAEMVRRPQRCAFLRRWRNCTSMRALSRAALCDSAVAPSAYARHREALKAHQRQLRTWAANCPENFEDRAALVGAEIARIEGRELDADAPLRRGHPSARANGFVHNEALAYELAARFYAARGFESSRMLICGKPGTLSALGRRRQGAAARSAPSAAEAGGAGTGSNGHDRCTGRTARYRDRDRSLASTLRRGSAGKAYRQAHACGYRARWR